MRWDVAGWAAVALLLFAAEALAPGAFMLWLGLAAAAVFLAVLLVPGIPLLVQVAAFVLLGFASVQVYRALSAGQVTALAFQVEGRGYAGEIDVLLGLDADGRILGARVLSHKETPGLGDKIEVAKDDWILAFDGLSLGDPPPERWAVKKDGGDFDQFSGATITPRAVVRALKGGLEFFAANRAALTAPAVASNAGPVRTSTTDH